MAPGTVSTAVSASLLARFSALDDFGRTLVLRFLIGYSPEAVSAALDEAESSVA